MNLDFFLVAQEYNKALKRDTYMQRLRHFSLPVCAPYLEVMWQRIVGEIF